MAGDGRSIRLADLSLSPGTHALEASAGATSRAWVVDANAPTAMVHITSGLGPRASDDGPEYTVYVPFTMSVLGFDDKPGYVVRQFRVDGDGWQTLRGLHVDAPFGSRPPARTSMGAPAAS